MLSSRKPFSLFLLFSLAFAAGGSQASEVREVIYRGQPSESFEMRDAIRSGGNWGGEAKQADVRAQVKLAFGPAPAGVVPEETFIVKLDEDTLELKVKSSGKLLISQKVPTILMDRTSQSVVIDASYEFSFIDITPVVGVLDAGVKKVQAKNGMLFFEASPEFFERNFVLRLSIFEKTLFGRGEVVFDRRITSSSLKRIPTEDGMTLYSSSLSGLGVPSLPNDLYLFELFVSFDSGSEAILNASDLPGEGRMRNKLVVRTTELAF